MASQRRAPMGQASAVEGSVFEEVAGILPTLVPRELGELGISARRYGIKVWFGGGKPPRIHYEAQVIGPKEVPEATVLAVEVGFHTELPKADDNDEVLAGIRAAEKRWRKELGVEPVCGPFLGRANNWRRVSETWPDPDLSDPELPFELAARLTDYITALEPVRRTTRA